MLYLHLVYVIKNNNNKIAFFLPCRYNELKCMVIVEKNIFESFIHLQC